MNKAELAKIAAKAAVESEGIEYKEEEWAEAVQDDFAGPWEAGAEAVYRKAIEDAEGALDWVDENNPWGDYDTKPAFREEVRAKLRELLE